MSLPIQDTVQQLLQPQRTKQRQQQIYIALAVAVAVCASITLVTASSGDRQEEYQSCVADCDRDICQSTNPAALTDEQREVRDGSLSQQAFLWSCLDNCRYLCMQSITQVALLKNEPVHQYHGKWPFYRLLGMQEPASVLFSVINGYMHVRAWPKLQRTIPENYYLRPFYLGYAIVGINTWLWSAVYHARDWPSTEKLDYFSAGTAITYGLYYTVIRVFHIVSRRTQFLWGLVCLIPLLLHIGYLGLIHFDYGYNMAATATVGMLHNLVWIGWCIKHWKERPYSWEPVMSCILITAAMCLEILDFAPLWGILDAHSLWHAATIPLVPIWYRFLLKDTEWEVRHRKGNQVSHRD